MRVLLLFLLACTTEPDPPVDASVPDTDAGSKTPLEIEVTGPTATTFVPPACSGTETDGVCAPYVFDEASVGQPCPAGDFPEVGGLGRVLYVRPGGNGDGSELNPFGTIQAAMDVAIGGTTVVVGKGTYEETVSFSGGVSLYGACPEETIIFNSAPSNEFGVLDVLVSGASAKNLTVAASGRPAAWVEQQGTLTLEDVIVESPSFLGLAVVFGARLTARRVIVRGTQPFGGRFGRGMEVQMGSSVELEDVLLEDNIEAGIFAFGEGTTVTMNGVVVRGTTIGQNGLGRGLHVQQFASMTGQRIVLERNADSGLVAGDGAEVSLTDLAARDGAGRPDGRFGRGVSVQGGATLQLERAFITDNRNAGISIASPASTATLKDVIVTGTQPGALGESGGIIVTEGASVTVENALLEENQGFGLVAQSNGTTVTASDVTIHNTRWSGSVARAVDVQLGATITMNRLYVSGAEEAGVLASEGEALLEDVIIEKSGTRPDGRAGHGLVAQDGTSLTVRRAHLSMTRDVGLLASGANTTLEAEDLTIDDTLGDVRGRAVQIQTGASATLRRMRIARAQEIAVAAYSSSTTVTLEDVEVTDTKKRACAETTCPMNAAGTGIGAYQDASLTAVRFRVDGSPLCGIQLARDGQIDLSQGEVTNNAIGACVQNEGYDLDRLTDRVDYLDNGRNLESTDLPIPESDL